MQHLENRAEKYLKERVTSVIITVPGYFTETQIKSIRDAANLAGLESVRIMNDVTATALMYCTSYHKEEKDMRAAIVKIDGGGVSASIIE